MVQVVELLLPSVMLGEITRVMRGEVLEFCAAHSAQRNESALIAGSFRYLQFMA